MARSTAPMLAVGAIAAANNVILNDEPKNTLIKIGVGTGVAVGMLTLVGKASEDLAVGIAYIALAAILFVRLDPSVPSPVESFNNWWFK